MPRISPTTTALTLLAAAALAGLVSCNILGPAGYLIAGPEKAEALFALPKDKTTVFFVDDRNSILPSRPVRQTIAQSAEKALLSGKVLTADLISSDSILPVTTSERFERPRTIAEVGQAVGAKTIIYATVDAFGLTPDGAAYNPGAVLRVKVIDADTQKRLFPEGTEKEWQVLQVTTDTRTAALPKTVGERTIAEQEFAKLVGLRLGQMFIKHEARDANPRIGK
ncbi:MAG: hypothetical protein K2Q20_15635 [Phycisphaerales bacterium]|nr:hypothetical protein [Phycisphaerales bacterium]